MPNFKFPYRQIEGIPQISSRQIIRDLEEVDKRLRGLSTFPYVLVASDGTGDYTSIKTAIEAQPTGESIQRVIFVKPSTTAYADTTTGTDIGNRRIVLIALQPGRMVRTNNAAIPSVLWNIVSLIGTTDAWFTTVGIQITSATANAVLAPSASVAWTINFVDSQISAGTNAAVLSSNLNTSSVVSIFKSSVSPLGPTGGGSTFNCFVVASQSNVAFNTGAGGNIYLNDVLIDHCSVALASTHFKGNDTRILNSIVTYAQPLFTTGVGGANTSQCLQVSGNVERGVGLSATGTFTVNVNVAATNQTAVNFSDNNLLIKLIINGAGVAQRANRVYIDGGYGELEINCDGVMANVVLNAHNNSNRVSLTVTTAKCVINAVLENGNGVNNQGYNFTAASATNLANISQRGYAVASVDAGAGNNITVV